EILGEVKAAGTLLIVLKVAIPVGLVRVRRVRRGDDTRHAVVGMPHDAPVRLVGGKAECRVHMVQRMVVATREERAQEQADAANRLRQTPAQHGGRRAVWDENFLLDGYRVVESKGPCRPRLRNEAGQAAGAVRMRHVRRVDLRREWEGAAWSRRPGIEAIDE